MYTPEVILLPGKEILVPDARLNHCVVCQSRGPQPWSPVGFRLGQAIPTAASRPGVPQRASSISIVTYSTMQGTRAYGTSCLLHCMVGVEV